MSYLFLSDNISEQDHRAVQQRVTEARKDERICPLNYAGRFHVVLPPFRSYWSYGRARAPGLRRRSFRWVRAKMFGRALSRSARHPWPNIQESLQSPGALPAISAGSE